MPATPFFLDRDGYEGRCNQPAQMQLTPQALPDATFVSVIATAGALTVDSTIRGLEASYGHAGSHSNLTDLQVTQGFATVQDIAPSAIIDPSA